ncbi:hypothetical protein B9Z55_012362 [Caenorhabditis nigoni]|uniref:Serpentine receptor class gamma n=2 Tax=Caenorhabditis nigoni TaxID=1611254 RepID=A0A2G5TWX2_9PELO|nr:hypothetical protein B9Z55_012362 [Caenorhabditis nigoni]
MSGRIILQRTILYLPILYIIFKTKLIKYACYKLIVFLALTDMSATDTWCMACAINIALFANRVCSIAFHEYIDVIEGKMTWISMVVAFVYGMYILFFTPVICFNSVALAWIPEPLSEKEPSEEAEAMYDNEWQSANNYLFVVIMSFLYVTYCLLVKKLAHGQKSKKSRAIFIQCAVICFFNTVTALVYNALSLMTPALWIVLLGQLCWSINHGCPAIIYLTMNDTIRHSFLNLFGGKRVTKVDTTNSAQHVAVSHVI